MVSMLRGVYYQGATGEVTSMAAGTGQDGPQFPETGPRKEYFDTLVPQGFLVPCSPCLDFLDMVKARKARVHN